MKAAIKWTKNGESKCGRFWTMNTRVGWRLYDRTNGGYGTFMTFKECKEWAAYLASK